MNTKIELFENKADCCGCGACYNACPKGAISLEEDECGYIYPNIDKSKCISCGLCNRVCPLKKSDKDGLNKSYKAYAVALKDRNILKKSASGGAFSGIAKYILENGGVVYGAAYDEKQYVHHIGITKLEELSKLQDSKYVQSDVEKTYADAKANLINDKLVLFSGTPCQIAGLKSYLGKEYKNLYTIDLICHGVPCHRLFWDGITSMVKPSEEIKKISFRDKATGWGTDGYILTDKRRYIFDEIKSSYYYYFLRSTLYRESCYACRYATDNRPADITIGDYWRIETAHPGFREIMNEQEGVSCVLINSKKGEQLIADLITELNIIDSTVDLVKERNGRLREADLVTAPKERKVLLDLYREEGYQSINQYWHRHERRELLLLRIKDLIRPLYKKIFKRVVY